MSYGNNGQNMMVHNLYMHLIDGKPAYYDKKAKAIYYAQHGVHRTDMFRENLQQIRAEQHIDAEERRKEHIPNHGGYGYLRVRVGNK